MTHRERFLACVLGEPADRPPFWLNWSPWETTWQRWQREGMPAEWESIKDVRTHYGADVGPRLVSVNYGPCPRIEQQVLEENDDDYIWTDTWGIKRRNPKGHMSMSEFFESPVKSRADWERFKAERLDPDHPDRLLGDWREKCAEWIAAGHPIQIGSYPDVGMYGSARWLLGDEECLLAFYDMPELIHEIMEHMTDIYLTVFEQIAAEVRVDVIHIWEDMCGRQGPLISPAHWDEFLGPCYRRVKAFAESRVSAGGQNRFFRALREEGLGSPGGTLCGYDLQLGLDRASEDAARSALRERGPVLFAGVAIVPSNCLRWRSAG